MVYDDLQMSTITSETSKTQKFTYDFNLLTMQLTLTKFRTQAGKYGTELLLTHIKLSDDKGKYIKFLSVEEALPYLQDHTFTIGDIEKYIDKSL